MLFRAAAVFLLVFFSLTASACGYFLLGERYRIALFNPYLSGDEYAKFFYTSQRFKHWKTEKSGRDRLKNADVWAKELGRGVTGADVEQLLYGRSFLQWKAAAGNPEGTSFSENPAWRALTKRPDLLEYILYAKAYEAAANDQGDWGRGNQKTATSSDQINFRERAETGYKAAKKGSFLQQRYGYQLLLLAYYRKDAESMKQYFNAHFNGQPGPLAEWARFHYAGQWEEKGRYHVVMANAFRYAPEKAFAAFLRTTIGYGTRPYQPEDYLAVAKTDAERSNLYALAAVQTQGYALDLLQRAYRFDPTNPVIELLLVREIGKLEDWLMTYELTCLRPTTSGNKRNSPSKVADSYEDRKAVAAKIRSENYQRDRDHLGKLRKFLDSYASADQRLADILRAQAALLGEDYQEAIDQLSPFQETDDAFGQQVATIRFLAALQTPGLPPAKMGKLIAAALPRIEAPFEERSVQRNAPSRLASLIYAASGDTVTAYLLHNRSLPLPNGGGRASEHYQQLDYLDRPISDATLRRIIRIMDGGAPENEAQRMLVATGKEYLPSVPDLRNLAGTLALRRNDLETALFHFAEIPHPEKGKRDRYNPRFSPLSDIVGQKISLTSKADVIRQMLAMQTMTGTGGDAAAAACLTLATAWYNMTDMGCSWWMLRYGLSVDKPARAYQWPYSGRHLATPHHPADYNLIYLASRADDYLDCAEASVEDEELTARIAFLRVALANGRANHRYAAQRRYTRPDSADSLRKQQVLQNLLPFMKKYHDTEYLWELRGKCSLVRDLY